MNSTKRNLKPRDPIAISVAGISQLNCEPTLGINPRRFLDLVVPRCKRVAPVGNLRVVALEEVQRVLYELGDEQDAPPDEEADLPPQPDTADGVLRHLGLRVAGGKR